MTITVVHRTNFTDGDDTVYGTDRQPGRNGKLKGDAVLELAGAVSTRSDRI